MLKRTFYWGCAVTERSAIFLSSSAINISVKATAFISLLRAAVPSLVQHVFALQVLLSQHVAYPPLSYDHAPIEHTSFPVSGGEWEGGRGLNILQRVRSLQSSE